MKIVTPMYSMLFYCTPAITTIVGGVWGYQYALKWVLLGLTLGLFSGYLIIGINFVLIIKVAGIFPNILLRQIIGRSDTKK